MIEATRPGDARRPWRSRAAGAAAGAAPAARWRHRLTVLYAPALAVCFLAAALPLLFGLSPIYCYADLTSGAHPFAGIMTAVSGVGLGSAGVVFVLVGQYAAPAQRPAWRIAGAGCLWLAVDELMMWHEALNDRLAAIGVPRFLGVADQDMYVFLLYGLGLLWVGRRLLPTVTAHPRALPPLAIAAACFAVSVAADVPAWDELSRVQRGILGPLEEGSKLLGVWSVVLYAAFLLDGVVAGARRPAA